VHSAVCASTGRACGCCALTAYYNEIDPYATQWLRNLIAAGHIAPGDVDERSIADVTPDDLRGYTQAHFFAGIGIWSHALRSAGWPDDRPVWTGSCPCQPFSFAARGRGVRGDDGRHLWPVWRGLIAECAPCVVIGEQIASAGDWFDGVCDDLEGMGYAIGAAVLPACGVGLDHARHRLFFVGHADRDRESSVQVDAEVARLSWGRSNAGTVARADGLAGRVGRLRAYGNAIVAPVAQAFIEAYVEATHTECG
jgi:DNA (cytosine-5)-methyltransferase 1